MHFFPLAVLQPPQSSPLIDMISFFESLLMSFFTFFWLWRVGGVCVFAQLVWHDVNLMHLTQSIKLNWADDDDEKVEDVEERGEKLFVKKMYTKIDLSLPSAMVNLILLLLNRHDSIVGLVQRYKTRQRVKSGTKKKIAYSAKYYVECYVESRENFISWSSFLFFCLQFSTYFPTITYKMLVCGLILKMIIYF